MRRTLSLVAALLLAGTALAGCRDSGNGSGSSDELYFAVIGTFQAPGTDYRDAQAAVQAKVDEVNAAGGVNGKKLKVSFCDDQHDPNKATTCARDAVSEHALAALLPSSASGFGTQVLPILEAAKIPAIGEAAAVKADWTNPIAYPLDPGGPAQYAGVALVLKNAGCTEVGAIQLPVPAGEASANNLAKAVKALGGRVVKNIVVGMSESSYAPQVAQLASEGAKCIVPIILPTEEPKFLTAVHQSGHDFLVGGVTAAFNQQLLTSLGKASDGILLAGPAYLPTDTSIPAVKDMLDAMAKYTPKTKATDTYATLGWGSSTLLFDSILPKISGAVTAAKITDALNSAKDLDAGTYAPYTFSDPPPNPAFARLMNTKVITWKVKNAVPVVNPGFTDVSDVLGK